MADGAKRGDNVHVHYTGKLEDGTVFDTSREREPLGFTIGSGQVIAGFEKAVVGMEPGEEKTTEVPPESGYGRRRDDLVIQIDKERIAGDVDPEVGDHLNLRLEDDRKVPVRVTEIQNGTVTIDANHPLAGKTLVFDIELVSIDESSGGSNGSA